MEKVLYIVHSVDTEGPLYESLSETFIRVNNIFGLSLECSKENLELIQKGELDLKGKEKQVQQIFNNKQISFNETWPKVNDMLYHICSPEFRNQFLDDFGNGWIYNWHCVDHIDYDINPRRKTMGYHSIFDHYSEMVRTNNYRDGIHWHFHPLHHSRASHICATSYLADNRFLKLLTRKVLERNWFPSVNRAGFHVERPDSHWLLEQWIPFDLSNQAYLESTSEQDDLSGGRFGDWRRAPNTWQVYHPSHDDYQVPGNCRRLIGRCLNVGSRLRSLEKRDVLQAFEEADRDGKGLMGLTNHDFRDMAPDVLYVIDLLKQGKAKYPGVKIKFCEAREAFNRMAGQSISKPEANILSATITDGNNQSQKKLIVESKEGTFGPQPFLAIQTKSGEFFHDNFDFERPFHRWHYTFDYQTMQIDEIRKISIASNDRRGFPHVLNVDLNVQ